MSLSVTIDQFGFMRIRRKNLSGARILQGTIVDQDPTPSAATTFDGDDPFSTTPVLDQPFDSEMVSIKAVTNGTTIGDTQALGVAETDIEDGEWGNVVIWGPCKMRVADTADLAHGTAYGVDATADGEAGNIGTVAGIGIYTIAAQVGQSGATTSGDLRDVYVLCGHTAGLRAESVGIHTPVGDIT